jgi:hypothetical protein
MPGISLVRFGNRAYWIIGRSNHEASLPVLFNGAAIRLHEIEVSNMKKLVFLLEEKSMKETLDNILPLVLPKDIPFLCIPHEGKEDLQKSIPRKLLRWREPDVQFIIVHDQDSGDCIELKQALISLAAGGRRPETLVRIVCTELESWFLGDMQAVEKAFNIDLKYQKNKSLFRNPDSIQNAKQELKKLAPKYQQISGSQNISKFMDIENNRSHSFNVFISGVKKLYA